MSLGLINRKNGRYSLSSFGRVVYQIQKTIETAIQNRWRFVALDSLESSLHAEGMPAENKIKIIKALLGDHDDIKNMLLYKNGSSAHVIKWALFWAHHITLPLFSIMISRRIYNSLRASVPGSRSTFIRSDWERKVFGPNHRGGSFFLTSHFCDTRLTPSKRGIYCNKGGRFP